MSETQPLNPIDGNLIESTAFSNLRASVVEGQIPLTDLFQIIFSRLHPLFSIDCGTVLIYDPQVTVIREAYVSAFDFDLEKLNTLSFTQPSELTAIQKAIAGFSYPVLKTAEEWQEEENNNHILINGAADYRYHCYIPLEVNNRLLGTLELHNKTKELGTECLRFCSLIADLLSDIIYLQSEKTVAIESRKILPDDRKPTAEPKEHRLLKDHIELIDSSSTLEAFLNESRKLFPSAYEKLKSQLDEITAYQVKLSDETVLEIKDNEPIGAYEGIIGQGPEMKKVFALMDRVAASESTVLILGETGTGKELIAKAIHNYSARRDKPMIMVNCAAIPANLIESELFGHEKGSFTGATDKRVGKFELANEGTLFLDEIGELPLDLQVKLLRALQEKEIERVGGKTLIKTDVRVISATNRDLLGEVAKGHFRQDLYFRLNVFPISLPALRHRTEDLPLLADHFLIKYAKKANKDLQGFTKGALRQMREYNWPGNVREMEHLIERQVLLTKKPIIAGIEIPVKEKTLTDKNGVAGKVKTIDENERDHIFEVLQLCNGRISGASGAAKLLGVPATTLNSKIKRLGLNKKHF